MTVIITWVFIVVGLLAALVGLLGCISDTWAIHHPQPSAQVWEHCYLRAQRWRALTILLLGLTLALSSHSTLHQNYGQILAALVLALVAGRAQALADELSTLWRDMARMDLEGLNKEDPRGRV